MRKTTNKANKTTLANLKANATPIVELATIDIKQGKKESTTQGVESTIQSKNATQNIDATQGKTYVCGERITLNAYLIAFQNQLTQKVVLSGKQVEAIDNYKKQLKLFNEKYATKEEKEKHESEKPTLKGELLHLYNKSCGKLDIDTKAIAKDIRKDMQKKLNYFAQQIDARQVDKNNWFKIKFDATTCVALWQLTTPLFATTKQIDYNFLKGALFSAYKIGMQKEKQSKTKNK